MMAMYAANNICKGIVKFAEAGRRPAGRSDLQQPERRQRGEMIEAVRRQTRHADDPFRPARQRWCRRAEINRKTVIEWNKECHQADEYRALAKAIDQNKNFVIPKPLAMPELEKLLMEFGLYN
jgi:nitrogenase iron protein NifH